MKLLRGLVMAGAGMKTAVKNGREKFKIAITRDTKKLEKKLIELGVDLDKIECIGCKKKMKVDDVYGIYGYKGVIFFFCKRSECQIEASHKLLDLENK